MINPDHIIYIFFLQIFLMVTPIIIFGIKLGLFKKFSWRKLRRVINWSLLIQILTGLLLSGIAQIIDEAIYARFPTNSTVFTDVFMELTMCYIVIGIFIYLPIVALINLISLGVDSIKVKL